MHSTWFVTVQGQVSGRREMLIVSAKDEQDARAIVARDTSLMTILNVTQSKWTLIKRPAQRETADA